MSNAFAEAAAAVAGQAATPQTDQLTGNNEGYDPLFGGGKSLPSVFNKSHGAGDEVTGVISDAPFDKHSRFMDEDETGRPISGKLKYWGEDNKPTDQPTGPNGPRRPVMDTVIPLSTTYRDKGEEDKGDRAWYVAGKPALDAMRLAIKEAGVSSRPDMVGMRLVVKRTGKSGRAWLYKATLSR